MWRRKNDVDDANGEDDEAAEEAVELGAEFEGVFGEAGNDEISMGTTLHLGWQCSYRSSEPEKNVQLGGSDFPRWANDGKRQVSNCVHLV